MQYNAVLKQTKANRKQTVQWRSAFCVLQNINPAVFELKCQWSIGLLQSLKYALP